MAALPLIERELRVALRKSNPSRRRLVAGGWAIVITALLILIGGLTGDRHTGGTLKNLLLIFGLAACISIPARAAGTIAEERRNQTLGLLFLAGLGPMEVFFGKLLGAAVIAFSDLLVIFPLLALPFFMGGVSFDLFLATVCCLPNVLLFTLALSLLASTLARDESAALVSAFVVGAVICGAAPLVWLGERLLSGGTQAPWWLVSSPAYGPFLVATGFGGASAHLFWVNFQATLVWSLLFLLIAAVALRRLWRREEEGERVALHRRGQDWLPDWLVGPRPAALRPWLEENPGVWLELTNRRPRLLAWGAVAVILVLWLTGWLLWPGAWLGTINFFITSVMLNICLGTIQSYATGSRFGNARRDGSLELLLTTPLSPRELVEGHQQAQRERFREVVAFVFTLQLVMALGGVFLRPWTTTALLNYALIWSVLLCLTWGIGRDRSAGAVGWMALNSAQASRGVWGRQSKWVAWYWIYIIFMNVKNLRSVNSNEITFPTGSVAETVITVLLVFMFWLIRSITRAEPDRARERLVQEFRDIVREPIPDPDDPRFKKWKEPHKTRFPWGPAGFQDQVIERNARRRAEAAGQRE